MDWYTQFAILCVHPVSTKVKQSIRHYTWLVNRQIIRFTVYWYAATCQSIKLTECLYRISLGQYLFECFFFLFSFLGATKRTFYGSKRRFLFFLSCFQLFSKTDFNHDRSNIQFIFLLFCQFNIEPIKMRKKYQNSNRFACKVHRIDRNSLFWFFWSTFCKQFCITLSVLFL